MELRVLALSLYTWYWVLPFQRQVYLCHKIFIDVSLFSRKECISSRQFSVSQDLLFQKYNWLRYQKLCASYVLALYGYCLRCSCQKRSECRCSLLVFFSGSRGSLRSGIETGGGVWEKEREIFPFMFIAFLSLYTTSLYCACQVGYSSGSYEERTPGLRFPLCYTKTEKTPRFSVSDREWYHPPFPSLPFPRCLGPATCLVSVEILHPNHFFT